MNNILLLHIGTNKTGTTAIQDFLAMNRESLGSFWEYPDLFAEFTNSAITNMKNGCLLNNSVKFNWNESDKNRLWRIIKSHLSSKNVIVSEESMWGDDFARRYVTTRDRLKDFKGYYDRLLVLVYLRRQDLYIESLWNQCVKSGSTSDDIYSFYKSQEDGLLHYSRVLSEIEDVIGKENIIVRAFEGKQFEGESADVISDFVYVLNSISDLSMDLSSMVIPNRVNESLPDDVLCSVLTYLKEYYNITKHPIPQEIVQMFIKMQEEKSDGKKSFYLSREKRKEILIQYSDENAMIARRYLNRNDGKLFFDDNIDYPLLTDYEVSKEETERIVEFAKLTAELSVRIQTEKTTLLRHPIRLLSSIIKREI